MEQRTIEDLKALVPDRLNVLKRRPTGAVPASNEADRICRCLAALATQRDRLGSPISAGDFGVLLLVNNSSDATAIAARRMACELPYPLEILEVSLQNATAGAARRRAMEEAAKRIRAPFDDGVLLTTDADSTVTPTWYANNLDHIRAGADCVAGYIDA